MIGLRGLWKAVIPILCSFWRKTPFLYYQNFTCRILPRGWWQQQDPICCSVTAIKVDCLCGVFCKFTSSELQNWVFLASWTKKKPHHYVCVLAHHAPPPGLCSHPLTTGYSRPYRTWESCLKMRTFLQVGSSWDKASFCTSPPSHHHVQQKTRPRLGSKYKKKKVTNSNFKPKWAVEELYWCTITCFPLEKLVVLGLTCGCLNHREPVSGGR